MVRLIPRLGVKTAPRILRFLRTNKTAANIRIKACHLSTVFEHKINVSNDIGAITPNVSAPRKNLSHIHNGINARKSALEKNHKRMPRKYSPSPAQPDEPTISFYVGILKSAKRGVRNG